MDTNLTYWLTKIIVRQKNFKSLMYFLGGILTYHEIKTLSTRIEILHLLRLGLSHRCISRELDVGISTITRINREMQLGRFDDFKDSSFSELV